MFNGNHRGSPSRIGAEEKPKKLEYKLVVSSIETTEIKRSVIENGKERILANGPTQSAELMTKQFNDLAAEGWEYVGPVASWSKTINGFNGLSIMSLFKRPKQ